MKWSFPHFMYKGMLCNMAAFKEHCSFGFWKSSLILEKGPGDTEQGMGQFGRITQLSDLPSKKILSGYIKEAMQLNDAGVKSPTRSKPKTPKEVVVPDDLRTALQKNKKALAVFEKFPPSQKREYTRLDYRRQDRGHAHQAAGDGDRMDRRGKTAKLEVHELLEGRSENLHVEKTRSNYLTSTGC